MLQLKGIHHVAIICSNYERSKHFYMQVLGFTIVQETYRADRRSYKLDLALNGVYMLELFSFPAVPARPTQPEAAGLRHLAFEVEDLNAAVAALDKLGIVTEPLRTDEITQKSFTFLFDPDHLPIELYEK